MKRRNFVKSTAALASFLGLSAGSKALAEGTETTAANQYYELRTYELVNASKQQDLDAYFQGALIPALKRHGATAVGAFTEKEPSETPRMYLLIVYPKLKTFQKMASKLADDAYYQATSQTYVAIPNDKKVYTRYHTSLLQAFDSLPKFITPPDTNALRELRIYEAYSEDAHRRKVKMFDDEELDLFYKVGLHPVFFGKALIGPDLPNLTYMLTFKDQAERDANWKKFVEHPDWAAMKDKPIYENTVSKVRNYFIVPTDYSEI